MEIIKLNCAGCGAPINIPENVEFLNCISCGSALAVQRGEGYVTLKMVKEVTEAIRDGTYATKSELQKLQLTQEISMLEMQLGNLRGEIRGIERAEQAGTTNLRLAAQQKDLHYQEYLLIERIRKLRANLDAITLPNPDNDLASMERQLDLVQQAIEALDESGSEGSDSANRLQQLNILDNVLTKKIEYLKILSIKEKLNSSNLSLQAVDYESVRKNYNIVSKDIEQLEKTPRSAENQIVLNELRETQRNLYIQWKGLENSRIRDALQSIEFPEPSGTDESTIQRQLAALRADIQQLESWEQNEVSRSYLQQLRTKDNQYQKYLNKLERKSKRSQAAGLAVLGLGTLFASIAAFFNKWFGGNPEIGKSPTSSTDESVEVKRTQPVSESETDPKPLYSRAQETDVVDTLYSKVNPYNLSGSETLPDQIKPTVHPSRIILSGIGIGLIPFIGLSLIGFVILMFQASSPESLSTAGTWLFITLIGYLIGAILFFRHTRHLSIKRPLKAGGIALAAAVGIFLLFTSLSLMTDTSSEDLSTGLIGAGLCLTPISLVVSYLVSLRFIDRHSTA